MIDIDLASFRSGKSTECNNNTSITGVRHEDNSPLSSTEKLILSKRKLVASSREKRIIHGDFNSFSTKTKRHAKNRSEPMPLLVRALLLSIFLMISYFETKDRRALTTQVTKPAKEGIGKSSFVG
jgi:hypothetical protein